MRHIYSGNLIQHNHAVRELRAAGFIVLHAQVRGPDPYISHEEVRIETLSGEKLVEERFWHRDPDVQINAITSWLNKQLNILKTWK